MDSVDPIFADLLPCRVQQIQVCFCEHICSCYLRRANFHQHENFQAFATPGTSMGHATNESGQYKRERGYEASGEEREEGHKNTVDSNDVISSLLSAVMCLHLYR